MRRCVALAAAVGAAVAVSACGGGDQDAEGATSCAAILEWEGERYLGGEARLPVPVGARLGTAVRPLCDDGRGAVPEAKIEVARIVGVDPAVAITDRLFQLYDVLVDVTRKPAPT